MTYTSDGPLFFLLFLLDMFAAVGALILSVRLWLDREAVRRDLTHALQAAERDLADARSRLLRLEKGLEVPEAGPFRTPPHLQAPNPNMAVGQYHTDHSIRNTGFTQEVPDPFPHLPVEEPFDVPRMLDVPFEDHAQYAPLPDAGLPDIGMPPPPSTRPR